MDEKTVGSNSEACLQLIYARFDQYKKILDDDQQACDQNIASIREQALLCHNDDLKLRSLTGLGTIELVNQLDYLEQEALKTYEENKTCKQRLITRVPTLCKER